mgnify:CR=1 FL=1
MNISIICVGKVKEKYFTAASDEYKKRLSRFTKLEIIEVPDEKIPDNASEKEIENIKNKEGLAILSKLKNSGSVIALCIEGKELTSEQLAEQTERFLMNGSNLYFIIGGSLGLSDEVKKRADLKLSFGRMTLPHQLMRVVLIEQIYRAFKINHNESYHK